MCALKNEQYYKLLLLLIIIIAHYKRLLKIFSRTKKGERRLEPLASSEGDLHSLHKPVTQMSPSSHS